MPTRGRRGGVHANFVAEKGSQRHTPPQSSPLKRGGGTPSAEVGDFSRFPRAEKLAAFAGFVPKQRSSGEKVRLGGITHLRSKYLRTAMVEAAMRISGGYAPELHKFVEDLKPSCGAKRARVALARKMLTIMWAMIKHDTPYVPQEKQSSSSSSAIRKENYLDGSPET